MSEEENKNNSEEQIHPIGTLVIVLIYALLFVISWLYLYFEVYLPRKMAG
jgi:hypothetical protein